MLAFKLHEKDEVLVDLQTDHKKLMDAKAAVDNTLAAEQNNVEELVMFLTFSIS